MVSGSGAVSDSTRESHETDPLYTEHDISDELERHRDVSRFDRSDTAYDGAGDVDQKLAELDEKLDEVTDQLAERYGTVQDYIQNYIVDWVPEDDVIDSSFPGRAMVKAYILRLISPEINGFDSLQWRLEANQDLAAAIGFDPDDIPHHTTLSTQWWERYRPDFRNHVRYEAAKAALRCQEYDLEISDEAETLIEEYDSRNTDKDDSDIPEEHRLEDEERDRALQAAAEEMGEPLTSADYRQWRNETDSDAPHPSTITRRWGWADALEAAGLQPSQKMGRDLSDMLDAVERLRKELGDWPTSEEYRNHKQPSDPSPAWLYDTEPGGVGSWPDLIEAAKERDKTG